MKNERKDRENKIRKKYRLRDKKYKIDFEKILEERREKEK